MNIRKRLSLLFIGLVIVIMGVSSLAAYFFSEDHRYEDFYNRLRNKAVNTAKLLIEVEEVDAGLLEKIEQDNPTSLHNERIIILDYQNHVLYSSDPEQEVPLSSDLLNRIRLEEEVRFSFHEFEAVGILYADKFDRFAVIAAATDTFGKRKIRVLRNILLITFVISIVLVSAAGWIYSGRALQPISRVVDQVEKISETSLDLRVHVGEQQDELGRLATTFNQMLERLEKAFKAQKNFIANASHELRTPLTAITGKIEVNLFQERRTEEYRDVLQSLLIDVRHLNQLSDRLLMLAQTTAEGAARVETPLRLDELLWQAEESLVRLNPFYRVSLDLDLNLDDELLTIRADAQLLKAAIMNLMDNACKYSADHTVRIGVRNDRNELEVTFTDTGIGIPLEAWQHIFDPFFRATNAIGTSGHGIGLSLVLRIIHLHQGRISFSSEVDKGTRFTVHLPIGNKI